LIQHVKAIKGTQTKQYDHFEAMLVSHFVKAAQKSVPLEKLLALLAEQEFDHSGIKTGAYPPACPNCKTPDKDWSKRIFMGLFQSHASSQCKLAYRHNEHGIDQSYNHDQDWAAIWILFKPLE
jgi:hypothetical protein